ncbi:non-ribosomal peptide synthase/polyketide synthase [Archangium violaceum]|uniref:non-ribosomal peptide synthase/polyketide synthase n=1 Tax=Archangium violaceum TaxID=83451 RepID=UPI000B31DE75|nr:non-ribosomal peptide synthase/polyketide synthase [Archangium violaceum]
MLAVGLSEAEVRPLLSGSLSLAALNAPGRCVVSGPIAEVERLTEELKRRDVGSLRLPAPHAFHSADVEPFMPELVRVVASLGRSAPTARLVSSLTGTWATAEDMQDPAYWARQMRQPVRFASGVEALLNEGCGLLLEVGPGQDLTALIRANLDGKSGNGKSGKVKALPSLRRQGSSASEHSVFLQALGDAWAHGLPMDWKAFYARERRLRLSLPTYPFQEKRCWVDAVPGVATAQPVIALPSAPAATAVTPSTPAVASPIAAPVAAPAVVPAGREDMPRGDIEERVAALWRARLGLEYVGRDDSFLELGGNSLMAAQMLTQMRDTFGVNLPLADLFDSPTVAGIASRIEALLQSAPQQQQQQAQQKTLKLAPLSRDGELRLSYVQERTWRLEQFLPGLSAYNIPFVLRLEGALDARLLERAIQQVVQRHEALRTTYDTVDGRPVQRFHARVHIPLEVLVLDGTPEEREAEAMRLAREDAVRPFDLVKGPVLRATLLRLREDVHVLLCTIHHIVSDTLSVSIFVQEMAALYVAMRGGMPSPLPALPVQYADFGHWQRRNVSENLLAEQQQWWRQRLAGMPRRLNLPTDRPRPATCPLTSERMSVDYPPALANELVAFGRREGFTSYVILLAAWQALLHRYSGQTDIVVGTPIANRTLPELQPLIGYVAHSVALRTDLSGDPTFRELLGRVREVLLGAQNHPDVPFEQIVEELFPQHDIGRGRMTDSVFVLHNDPAGNSQQLPGLRASLVEVPDTPVQWGTTLADLTLVFREVPGQLHGALEYATELFDASTARRFLEHLRVLLTAGMARPDEHISRLPLLTGEERTQWLQPRPAPTSPSVPELLARRAASSPQAVAVMREGQTWTLGELLARARSLAARLHALGVKRGDPVAVCLEPSPDKLLALWGVLEAGASVVTLAPSELGSLPQYAPEGTSAPVLLTWRGLVTAQRLESSRVLYVESLEDAPASAGAKAPVRPEEPAWLLPAGASQPAWVLSHGGLLHLFDTLDSRLEPAEGSAWLAAAENAVERPELEWLWALSRGLHVLFPSHEVSASLLHPRGENVRSRAVDLSLMFFANDEDSMRGSKYELLIEGAKFADAHGFSAIWTPERHFHAFGGIYPQPALLAAAVATVTRNLRLRAGSVVLPLHDPLLVAEQWSVADNLSNGRVGVSVATGWHVQDFSYAPHNYENRRNILLESLKTLRAVWRGEKLKRKGGGGVEVEVGLRPIPVQRELPIWLTATSNPETFRMAGELGAGVLTGMLAHSFEELKAKVGLYREAWRRNGHPGRGHITVMLHTFIGNDDREVLETVHKPLLGYFRGSVDIVASLAALQGFKGDIAKVPEADVQAILERGFEHYAYHAGLIGSVENGVKRLEVVREADVDEVACLVDFGLDTPTVLQGLRKLAEVRQRSEELAAGRQQQILVESRQGVDALVELARSSGQVLMHASARLARSLSELPEARRALEPVKALVLEESSAELARALREAAGVPVLRKGAVADGSLVPRAPEEELPSEVQRWVLDESGQPVPSGVVGELALWGAGLPQQLWRASSEEHQRWVPHPLDSSARLFRTGRYVRMRTDGGLEPMSAPPARTKRPAEKERPANAVVPATATGGASTPPAIPLAPRNEPLPLSFAQQRLWYLQQVEPESATYNNGVTYRLSGPLNVAALHSALEAVVNRHEVLRTTYTLTEQGAVQLIHPSIELSMPRVELSASTSEARESEALRLCREHLLLPFDLEKGPVMRALLLAVEPEEHILNLVFHHIVSDAWSSLVLAKELVALYTAFCAGQPSPLPPMTLQYADFAVWQRKWLEGGVMEREVSWWKQRLSGVPPLDLPTDKLRPAAQDNKGALLPFVLPREVSEPLLALGRREGSTSFMVVMALFQTMLSRYSGQEDFAVGLPTAGRHYPGTEGLIGCFVNTLAVRASLDGAPSFRELLTRVRRASLEILAHQELPFERLVDALQVRRDLSRSPVFQVVLNVVNVPAPQADMADLRLSGVKINADTTKFDLSLEVMERADGLHCTLEYATGLFEPSTAARMAEHLTVLARQVVESPEKPLAQLPLLTEAERQRVLVEWNETRTEYPRDNLVHGPFEAQARRTPDAIAVQEGEQRLTYRELDERANQLAWHLRSLGVGPEVRVGLCAERSVELVVGLYAILKAGGAYVPLDPTYPRQRLEWMLEDARPAVLLAQPALRSRLPEQHGASVVPLALHDESLRGQPTHAPPVQVTPDNLAYVIFTSGSTGRPKGAMNAHRAVCNRLSWMQQAYGLDEQDVVLQKTPYSFDVSVWEFFWPLMVGARLVLARPGGHQEPDYLLRLISEQGVTTAHFVPSMLQHFLEQPGLEQCTRLRRVVCSGEALSLELTQRCLQRLPSAWLHNLYGPTEAAVDVTAFHCQSVEGLRSVPIGRPIANTVIRILDAHLRPVPTGVPGELFIGGVQVGRGYLSRPTLTAERFIPDPFATEPGARLYRTGDKARWLADGNIEYLGRLDFQVKVRGLRIELGEIESALEQGPQVRQAVVVVREDVPGDKRIVAYVVPDSGGSAGLDVAQLRDFLKKKLPEYMVPSAFVALETLPLTSSGKTDRKALPAPDRTQSAPRSAYVAPRNATEQRLSDIWAQVLGVKQVGIHDNFFELGGDSIVSLQVVARARHAGLALTARQFFQHQTIAELASIAERASAARDEQGPVTGEVLLTPIQRQFLHHDTAHAHHFNHSLLLEARQPLDAVTLEKALGHVVAHHDAFRARFTHVEGRWQQHFEGTEAAPTLRQVDLSSLPAAARPAALEAEAARIQAGFELSRAPLFAAALFHLGGAQRLFLCVHHLVIDGVSWRILMEDLEATYLQFLRGQQAGLPPKSTSYRTWARRLSEYASSEALASESAVWLDEARALVPALPEDASGENTYASAASVSVTLEADETRLLLQEVPAAWRSHINDVLLTALVQSFSEWTGQPRLLVNLEGHGREDLFPDVDLSRTIGWFTTFTPVLLAIPEGGSPGDCLRSVRDSLRQLPHHGIGFGLLRWMGPDSLSQKLAALSAPQVAFNYLGQFDASATASTLFSLSNEPTGPVTDPAARRMHPLEVNGSVLAGRLQLSFTYSTHLHHASTIQGLAQRFLAHLRALISLRHSDDTRRFTPTDFPLARISQPTLDAILSRHTAVPEDLYPLTPLQQGMLFHALLSPESGVYFEQLSWSVHSHLELEAFLSAWRAALERNPILRTSFLWEGLDTPLQLVHSRVELPFQQHDWRHLSANEQKTRLDAFILEDMRQGFDLARAPLMRLTAFRLQDDAWRFLWSHHHLLVDGWSVGLLLQDVFAFYDAFRSGKPLQRSARPPFRDYISWLQRRDPSADEAFWRSTLAGFSAPTPLPADTHATPPTGQPSSQHVLELSLSAEDTSAIQAFARQHQVTLNTLSQAAWALVLSLHSAEKDVLFGLTVSGRPPELPGIETMVGLFINSIPVRIRIPASSSPLIPWLHQLRSQQLELQQHEHTPLVSIHASSALPRTAPLFESLLVVENYPLDESLQRNATSLDIRDVHTSERTNFPLTLAVHPGSRIQLRATYDSARFDSALLQQALSHWCALLRGLTLRNDARLRDLPLLSQAERQQVLVEWNQTWTDYPRHGSIHGHFEAQARLTPDAIAVQEGEHRLTYRELDERANQLAWHLRSLGVGTEAMVGLLLERSTDMVVAMLATLKAGGAYLPLDTSYPSERLSFMLEDSSARVLITRQSLQARLPSYSARLLLLDSESSALSQLPRHAPPSSAGSDNLAHLIYTSGSTGRPKGVAVPHLGVLRLVVSTNYIRFSPEDCVAHGSNTAFDAATFEVWGALLSGARLLILSREQLLSPLELGATLRAHSVTTLFLTTALFNQVASLAPSSFSSLRDLVVGGEAIDVTSVRRVLEAAPPARLVNGYGPTESTTFATWYRIQSVAPQASSVPIGRPISNTTAFILDEHLHPVPPGVPGELYLGGDGLARGYFGRPELTAEKFIPHPFSSAPGARLYRTGDKARWLPDGQLEFLGRLDSQVKLRGFRIELGEVESALRAHPSVRQAIVVVRQDSGDKRLVAYVVPTSPRPPGEGRGEGSATPELNTADLSTFLKGSLPEYMVPSAFVSLESLPLTPNGKVDTRALPAPEASSLQSAVAYVAPRNELEQRLADIWAQVLGMKQVGIHDHFFELGGHSLLATQVVSRIRSAFQVELPLRALFEAPSVAALAAHLGSALQSGASLQAPPLKPTDTSGPLPLSFAQQRLWFIDQLQPGSSSYNMPYVLRLEGALDEAALQRAFTELVRRHHALRTTFGSEAGQPIQLIAPTASLPLSLVDLSSLPPSERMDEAHRLASHSVMRPFDLAHGPLLHASLFKLEERLHILALSMHHIVSDGWSMGILVREVAALYQAFSSGQPSPLPELPLQYADYAVWQRQWLQGAALEQQLSFWRQQLSGAPAALELPTDKPRPSVQSQRGALLEVHLPKALSESLKAFCQREGVTPFMALLASFQVLLSRYSGQDDISVGSPIAGRRHSELEGLIGFFVNTLVLRARLSAVSSFRELLQQVRETTLGAFAHQDIPFEKLVEELRPPRDLSRSPLFQVMFALQNAPHSDIELPGLSLRPLMPNEVSSKFDLTLSLLDSPEGFTGTLEYCSELFEHDTVSRMASHLGVLLESLISCPEAPLSSLPLLTDTERQQVLVEWNQTRTDYPRHSSIHGHFEAQARLTPDAIAVQEGAQSLTYRELDERANQLAWRLRSLGVGTETMVGLLLERSTDMVVSMLATLKAGGVYLPLDTSYPSERLAFMLEDSSARVLITLQSLQARLPSHSARLLLLDSESSALSQQPRHAPPSGSGSDNLAYLIYTSGSTGRPKGVAVPHLGVLRLILSSDYVRFSPEDCVAHASNTAFDAATFEVWGALLSGARLVILSREQLLSPLELGATLRAHSVSTLFLTTALFNQVASLAPSSFSSLRNLLFGGEASDALSIRRVLEAAPPSRLLNVYGPTESTTFATWYFIQSVAPHASSVPIGRPISNTTAFVLDEHLHPVPPGVPGELYLGGDGLARGYFGRPELTAEKFIPHPFSSAPGARLYRTGDKVRWLADGTLEFLSRLDSQVKLRGFRIELGEVESTLRAYPSVRQAIVVVRQDSGDKRLVAYVVPTSPRPPGEGRGEGSASPELNTADLSTFLKGTLPEYMVPSALVPLDALPLTPNGKVDTRALPAPAASLSSSSNYVAPSSELEQRLADIWAQVLHTDRIGIHDNFFELGGHSLLATQVVSRIRSTFQVELPLRALFEAPSVAALAAHLGSVLQSGTPLQAPPLKPADISGPLPLSFAQQRLWFIDQLQPGSSSYNMPYVLRLEGALDEASLQQVFTELVRRHHSLRTTFGSEAGQPVQLIAPTASLPLSLVDLSSLPPSERMDEAHRQASRVALRPFDLTHGPLIHASLFKLEERLHILVLSMHHIVSDGWSMGILVREVAALYQAFSSGLPSPLPELPLQYADYAVWQRQWLQGAALEQQLSYWKQHLSGAPAALELPTDKPRPSVQSHRGAHLEVHLPKALSESLTAFCQREGVTPFMALLASFQVLLSRYSGQDDISVGSPIAGRRHSELEGLIGFFVNTLVLRARFTGVTTFRELLQQVRETTLGAFAHQDIPFEKLVEELQPPRDLSRTPLFQVMFALQNAPTSNLELPGLSLRALPPGELPSKFDLTLSLSDGPDGFTGTLEYCTDLFEHDTARRMVDHLRVLLSSVLSQPDAPLVSLSLLTGSERHQLLVDWSPAPRALPEHPLVHRLFEAQVRRSPDAPALHSSSARLTYSELNARSNQLARFLISLGVGPDSLVALHLERSTDFVIALLATLKAGGAWLPLDPSLPNERLSFILSDARPSLLLTHAPLDVGIRSFRMEAFSAQSSAFSGDDLELTPDDDNLAYAIYTSGSTGRPKGTLLNHRGLFNTVLQGIDAMKLGPDSRALPYASIGFDASIWEMLPTLLAGGQLFLTTRDQLPPGLPLRQFLREHSINAASFTPSLLALLEPQGLESLHTVAVGGEVLAPELAARWKPGRRFLNVYGPTEASIVATLTDDVEPRRVSIGRPFHNVQAYVLDEHLRPLPVGLPGELYLGGVGLARGYLGRPELTAEKFLPHPFSSSPGARLYRTGDKARWLPDGQLEFLGRLDSQVKLRGFRIELGEIESALRSHSSIRQAAVVLRQDSTGDKRLVSYLVAHEGHSVEPGTLRDFLKRSLPEYMVPSAFVSLEALPLSSSGKVDIRALPAPEASSLQPAAAYVAPRNELEQRLADVWAQVLGMKQVGIHDNFFEMGGHSLLATQVVSRIRSAFQVELPLRALFEAPSVASLAAHLSAAHPSSATIQAPPLKPTDTSGPLPLSFSQQRLWFLDQLQPGSSSYNMPFVLRLEGALDEAALQRVFSELVRRHHSLRTTFGSEAGQPVQRIAPTASLPLSLVDLSSLPPSERMDEAHRQASRVALRPFDLAHGPLIHASLFKLEERLHILVLSMHHIVSDGWSMGILVREVAALYQAFSSGLPSPLPELPLQYADYAVWQRQWLQGAALEQQLSYWRQQLSGAPAALELPTDKPRPSVQSHRGAHLEVHLPKALSESLTAFCQREGVTPFMALLASFQLLLSRYSGQDDISVGSPIAGRRHSELEGLIGFFVNTLVLRARLSAVSSFRELLHQVRETTLGAFAHQDIPFEKLVEELQPPRDLSRTPLFQVMFALQNAPASNLELPGLSLRALPPGELPSKFDLTLSLSDGPEGFTGSLEYCTDLFEHDTARRMVDHLRVLLSSVLSQPDAPLASLSLLTGSERHQLLVDWSPAPRALPEHPLVHCLFEAQARRTPDAPALHSSSARLTYSELNARSNQLARLLRSLGVGPDSLVALHLERSTDFVIALLATLKAGGAWLPLDPSLPNERLSFILSDARPSLLLTHSSLDVSVRSFRMEDLSAQSSTFSGDDLELTPDGDNLAYAIYTSGSTGRPKGTLLQHRGLCNTVLQSIDSMKLGPDSRVLPYASISFDASIWEMLPTLLAGGQLFLTTRDQLPPGLPLQQFLREHSINTAFFTPALLAILEPQVLESLHTVVAGGEALAPELAARWKPGRRFLNVYGPTEVSIVATLTDDVDPRRVSIGRPFHNVQAYVLDEHLRPLPVGLPGELYLGGVGLARGYLGRSELTAEKFLPHPFSSSPGERLYRTGDKVRWLPDGQLEFLGRLDSQVKLRGFRIELGEIESALRAHSSILQAAVVLRQDSTGDKRLVAYLVTHEGHSVEPGTLRDFLKRSLPEYMVPSAFVSLEALPLSSSGKVDTRALPTPDMHAQPASTVLAPRDELELRLTRLWEEVLGVHPVGVRGNFFELGGHSLLAVQLMARVREATGRELPLATLFRAPTVELLAALLRQESPLPWSPLVPLSGGGDKTPLFLVHPVGGNVFCYTELARQLGSERPIFGLQAQGLDGLSAPLSSVEEMAALYVESIRSVQPSGPYLLGGWSMGGVIAYEMASQLRQRGEQVELVTLIDSYVPQREALPELEPSEAAVLFLQDLLGTFGAELLPDWEQLQALEPDAVLARVLEEGARSGALPPGMGLEQLRTLLRVFESNLRANQRYTARASDQRLLLLKAGEVTSQPEDGGWSAVAGGGLERHVLPGGHHALLRAPLVRQLAELLREALASSTQDSRRRALQP